MKPYKAKGNIIEYLKSYLLSKYKKNSNIKSSLEYNKLTFTKTQPQKNKPQQKQYISWFVVLTFNSFLPRGRGWLNTNPHVMRQADGMFMLTYAPSRELWNQQADAILFITNTQQICISNNTYVPHPYNIAASLFLGAENYHPPFQWTYYTVSRLGANKHLAAAQFLWTAKK